MIGTTARTDGPRVPVNVSVIVSPRCAALIVPRNVLPISSGLRWVYRMPSGSMIVTKSRPALSITDTAYGWRLAVGSSACTASITNGSCASVVATARLRRAASSSADARESTHSSSVSSALSSTTATSWVAKIRLAMLHWPLLPAMLTLSRRHDQYDHK
jgi:hypothetical protein